MGTLCATDAIYGCSALTSVHWLAQANARQNGELVIFDFNIDDMFNDRCIIISIPCVFFMEELVNIVNYCIVEYDATVIGT